MATNECGECRACCVVLPIVEPELNKPAGEPCKHLCDKGCSVFGKSEWPKVCRTYFCVWRQNKWLGKRANYRPDKLGVVFDDFGDRLVVTEVRPGALESESVKWAIIRLRERKLVKMYPFGIGWGHKYSLSEREGDNISSAPGVEWTWTSNNDLILRRTPSVKNADDVGISNEAVLKASLPSKRIQLNVIDDFTCA